MPENSIVSLLLLLYESRNIIRIRSTTNYEILLEIANVSECELIKYPGRGPKERRTNFHRRLSDKRQRRMFAFRIEHFRTLFDSRKRNTDRETIIQGVAPVHPNLRHCALITRR